MYTTKEKNNAIWIFLLLNNKVSSLARFYNDVYKQKELKS